MTLPPDDDRPDPFGDRPDRSYHDPAPLDDPAAVELLVRYDRATKEELASLEADPVSAAILDRLRAVDRFLENGGLARDRGRWRRDRSRVEAEDLYAFANGPGAAEERGAAAAPDAPEIEAHLAAHPTERGWVESLENGPLPPLRTGETPPLEWDLVGEAPDVDGVDRVPLAPGSQDVLALAAPPIAHTAPPVPSRRSIPGWVAWTPVAAAALVLAMALGGTARRNVFDGGLPSSPVVRSARTTSLLFPRGRVIANSTDAVPAPGSVYAAAPLFEVTPVDGATSYRFELRRTSGDPFLEGTLEWQSVSSTPTTTAPALAAGTFTWSAWAVVDELETPLGSLHVEVVDARDVPLLLRERAGSPGNHPDDVRADVRELHTAGFLTDARHRARRLPPSDERSAYLGLD